MQARVSEASPLPKRSAARAGIEAVAGAHALSENEYKIQLAQVAVKRAILRAAGLENRLVLIDRCHNSKVTPESESHTLRLARGALHGLPKIL